MKRWFGSRAGFNLVEVSLAILVVAVGMTAAFGLFPTGLQSARRATSETREALFAEEVLSGIRALATIRPWATLEDDLKLLPPPTAGSYWINGLSLVPRANVGIQLNRYAWEHSDNIVEFAIRYDLEIQPHPNNPTIKYVRLEVSGEEGDGQTGGNFKPTDDTTVFYTEIYNTGLTNIVRR